MFKPMRLVLLALMALLIVALSASACGGEDEEGDGGGPAPSGPGVGEKVGVTDTTIKIGALLPLSNTTATAWGVPLSQGMKAFYDYINDNGGIYGRKIELIVGDSQYVGPVASETARKLVEQDGIFLLQGSLGTESHMAVYKYLEEKQIPDMWILTGNTIWTVPLAKTRFGFLVDYIDEGSILGKYIGENFDGKKVGILAQNDDFGKEGEKGVKQGLEESGADFTIADTQYYDATQTDVSGQMGRLKSDNVDVIAFYGMPAQAAGGIKYARETLNWDVPFVITGVDAVEIVAALTGLENIEGTVSVVYGHQAFESDWPGIKDFEGILKQYAPDSAMNNLTLTGMSISEATVNVLRQAGPDLTRSSFVEAAEASCKDESRASLVPTSMSPTDHRPTEVETYVRAHTENGVFKWVPFGEVMTFESTTDCEPPERPEGYDDQPH